MIHKAKVKSIKLSYKKGEDRIEVKTVNLVKNFGIEGDAYAKPGDREICLMTETSMNDLKLYDEGLCVMRFSESIQIDLDPNVISIGDSIDLDGVVIEITKLGKKCYPECELIKSKKTCPLSHQLMFARVLKGGRITCS